MNQELQNILSLVRGNEVLTPEQKNAIAEWIKHTDQYIGKTEFTYKETEKATHNNALLLKEAIEELQQKRKIVESQNRELEIEAALERVRARTMGMQKSDELKDTIQLLYDQMIQLNLFVEHAGFIIDWSDTEYTIWLADKRVLPFRVTIPYFDCAHWQSFRQATKDGTQFFANRLGFEETNKFYDDLFNLIPGVPQETKNYYQTCAGLAISTVLLDNIGLYIENFSGTPYTEEENKILIRFGKVFQQTYTRFLDLQKAEAQTREAQIEAGLERVRSRGMAMQTSEELAALIGTLFTELTKLDLVLTRCVVWIIDPKSHDAVWWMANSEDPSNPMSYSIPFHESPPWRAFMTEWDKRTVKWVYDLNGQTKKEWDDHLFSNTGLAIMPKFISDAMRAPERVLLSASFSNFGGMNVASLERLSDEHFNILLRFAKVFDLTYTRFNDLKQAEAQAMRAEQDLIEIKAARKKAEEALAELQATQQQLIHAEKMASLGELTAGIAHEIQNPLNFVNNFSELNRELLEELKQELETGNLASASQIAKDIVSNEEKINSHGKRADSIVKSMLQHSKISTGIKEPTDINALAEEFLRLSFHGFQAKDKSFNATVNTAFDSSIGKVEVMPQDIGRVLLNLFNNSFYSVNEKKKKSSGNYEPVVQIITVKTAAGVEIKIKDNGTGIPEKVLRKIYQPFFTTKPTGEGTGLGLSLSYDIITKGHGGDMKVQTTEGEGATFIVELPA